MEDGQEKFSLEITFSCCRMAFTKSYVIWRNYDPTNYEFASEWWEFLDRITGWLVHLGTAAKSNQTILQNGIHPLVIFPYHSKTSCCQSLTFSVYWSPWSVLAIANLEVSIALVPSMKKPSGLFKLDFWISPKFTSVANTSVIITHFDHQSNLTDEHHFCDFCSKY